MSSKPEVDNAWHERGELPPVGCECEYKPVNDWVKCKVLFAGDSLYVLGVQEVEICVRVLDVDFRPLRTEREKEIDEMANLIAKSVFGSAKCQAEKLYDSGYRKVNP